MAAQQIQNNALEKLAQQPTKTLCDAYEQTNTMQGDHVPTLRGWLMDTLEQRNQAAFDAWLSTDDVALMDKPSAFFN